MYPRNKSWPTQKFQDIKHLYWMILVVLSCIIPYFPGKHGTTYQKIICKSTQLPATNFSFQIGGDISHLSRNLHGSIQLQLRGVFSCDAIGRRCWCVNLYLNVLFVWFVFVLHIEKTLNNKHTLKYRDKQKREHIYHIWSNMFCHIAYLNSYRKNIKHNVTTIYRVYLFVSTWFLWR